MEKIKIKFRAELRRQVPRFQFDSKKIRRHISGTKYVRGTVTASTSI